MTDKILISIKDLTVVYNKDTSEEITALSKFSLDVNRGETIVITGGNGTGKSTLLKAINGTVPIKSGEIIIDGHNITRWSSIKRTKFLNIVNQDILLGTCPNLTILENFQLSKSIKWWYPFPYKFNLSKQQTNNIQSTGLPLDNRSTSEVNMLSGGQRQVIAVCLAFETRKPILLFDEFTSALDEATSQKVLDYTFLQAKKNNSTMILVMHNTSQIKSYTNNILTL